jgi:hypothetical protein
MVLFVNHSCEEFALGDNNTSRAFAEGVMATDEMSFHQEVPVQRWGFIDTDVEDFIAKVERHQHIFQILQYFRFFSI